MVIYDDNNFDYQYYLKLENKLKQKRTAVIDPDEKQLDKEVPIIVLKDYSNYFKKNKLYYLMYETNIYIADKLFIDKHYESSISWYMKVLKEAEHINGYNKIPHIYNRIGICEFKKLRYNDALIYYKKAKLESSHQNDKETYLKSSYNIAATYFCLKEYSCSEKYISEILRYYKDDKSTLSYALALMLKGRILIAKGCPEKGFEISRQLMHDIEMYDNKTKEHIFLFLTDIYQNIHSKNAVYYGELGLRYSMESKNYDFVLHFYKTLDQIYSYYHEYTCCYNNLKNFIKFMSDKYNRKFSNIFFADILSMKIKLLNYKYLSTAKSCSEI